MQTSSTSFTTNSMNTMSASQRFNGMIREKATKKLRNILFHFFDYITVTAPSMRGLQAFISIWRIIEFIGPSLCVGYIDFWGKGTNLMKTMDVISIIFHIFPGSELRKQVAHWFLIAEGCFFLLIILYVLLSAIYYHKYAQLPDFVPVSIFFIFSTFGYILPPIGMNFIGEIAGYMIQNPKEEVDGIKIFAMIFAFCAFFCFMVIFTTVYSVTLSFRSDSLTTIIPTNQSLITTLTLLVTFFPACGSKIVSMTTTIIFNLLAAITYAVSILVLFSKGGFVNQTYLKAMVSTATTGIIFCIIVALYVGSGNLATEVIIIIFVVVWIIVFILTSVGINRKTSKSLMMLDVILDDQESFNLIRNPRQFCQIVVDGFRNAHPSVLNFSVFKIAIEKWPKNYDIWLLFAKFMAIYPEQTQQLSYITIGMMQNKMKGNFAKHTMQQIGAAVKQRETNLIPELKTKIDRIGRKVSSNKAKIRYIWDLVLQGNVQELEPIIGRAYTSIIDTNIAFTHLIHMYPNNRFVARAYARFVRDVVADHEKHAELSSKVTNLQRGIQVEPDLYHDLGMYAFPNLPKQLESAKQISHQQGNITEDTLTQEIDGDDEKLQLMQK
ncbi:hypothetical protein TRFO_27831 [Tritrichomonas foetus]|uniref:Uncharacterized protein n=1 Tax=Tritrichomonas foetus TaxID=1144522 RepID=A0A1J4JZM7_9EUKA|nr:hypothetical protein TRFO_27831 [Tritrichomonas foetus]|eukprot:OHT04623.1 hypothetical protein TRFO_27831 [Tritrichomonas foetus]